jgi:dienelactone hydrolase
MIERFLILLSNWLLNAETLPSLKAEEAPKTHAELWQNFDPRKDALDVEILHEWEEDGVFLKILRYHIGTFKGQPAKMAAIYGYPKGAKALPGLVQIHGGGQYADHRAVLTNAKRGYATISLSWAGRISSPHYRLGPPEVKLFWDDKTEDPDYKITTDWGALDAYHAPSRYPGPNAFVKIVTSPHSLDPFLSPRNNSWFLCTLGARRALTFLEQQPQVNPSKLGVYGHSMGGKLTVLTAGADSRVKAAAPSCGGISDRYNKDPLHHNTVGDQPSLKKITCPTIFLSPSNDFHGRINDIPIAISEIKSPEWRVTSAPHLNHRDIPEHEVATQLWFDQHLKRTFTWPETPTTTLQLNSPDGIPILQVIPDSSRPIESVDVYYTQQGLPSDHKNIHENSINKFWHHSSPRVAGNTWSAALPLSDPNKPLWVYANVRYQLDEPIRGAGYYYGNYTAKNFTLSSPLKIIPPEELKSAGVKATLQPTPLIESFNGDWQKHWYRHSTNSWEFRTHKVYHPLWKAPQNAHLTIEVSSEKANTLALGLDDYAVELDHPGDSTWRTFTFRTSDFKDAQLQPLRDWNSLKELRLLPSETLRGKPIKSGKRSSRRVGNSTWQGSAPRFKNLRWAIPN